MRVVRAAIQRFRVLRSDAESARGLAEISVVLLRDSFGASVILPFMMTGGCHRIKKYRDPVTAGGRSQAVTRPQRRVVLVACRHLPVPYRGHGQRFRGDAFRMVPAQIIGIRQRFLS